MKKQKAQKELSPLARAEQEAREAGVSYGTFIGLTNTLKASRHVCYNCKYAEWFHGRKYHCDMRGKILDKDAGCSLWKPKGEDDGEKR